MWGCGGENVADMVRTVQLPGTCGGITNTDCKEDIIKYFINFKFEGFN